MPEVRIAAEPRTEFGKGPARRERRAGRVPAVLYGHGTESRHVSLPGHDVLLALRTANVLIRLDGLPGGSQLALPKAVQRDAIKGTVEHVDLIMVRRGEKVTVEIPVPSTGDVAPDGLLDQQLVQIAVEAEATNIPPRHRGERRGHGDRRVRARRRPQAAQSGSTLAVEPDVLVLHVIAAPTAEQIEAELGVPEAPEARRSARPGARGRGRRGAARRRAQAESSS